MKKRAITCLMVGIAAACGLLATPAQTRAEDADTIAKGVYIGSIDVGGMTQEEAVAAVETYVESAGNAQMTLSAGNRSVSVTARDLGIDFTDMHVVQEAMDVGRRGNLIQRYKDKRELENGTKVIEMRLDIDHAAVTGILTEKAEELDQDAVDSGLVREDGKFRIIPGAEGIAVDVDGSVQVIEDYIAHTWDGTSAEIELMADVVEPRGSEEELSQITDVLGTYKTNYSDSGANRCTNIAVATGFIDGTVLYPGEEFSVYEAIHPLDAANGYKLAGSYENGQTVESYGGGVCQVSTTLYNAAILAELEITERSNHSMIVTYVDPSMDAAIAGDYKDLRFVNNQELPIYIEGYTEGKNVCFNIYGHETRPADRKVSYVSEVTSQQDPGTQFVATGQPVGYIATAQGKHIGYTARLWKIVTVGGVEQSREVFNQSTYRASPKIVHVGTASADANASAVIGAALATGDEATIYNAVAPYTASAMAIMSQPPAPSPEEQAIVGNVDPSQITGGQ